MTCLGCLSRAKKLRWVKILVLTYSKVGNSGCCALDLAVFVESQQTFMFQHSPILPKV